MIRTLKRIIMGIYNNLTSMLQKKKNEKSFVESFIYTSTFIIWTSCPNTYDDCASIQNIFLHCLPLRSHPSDLAFLPKQFLVNFSAPHPQANEKWLNGLCKVAFRGASCCLIFLYLPITHFVKFKRPRSNDKNEDEGRKLDTRRRFV